MQATVRIDVAFDDGTKGHGTGVIIARYKRVHFVLTCYHVTCHGDPTLHVICANNPIRFEARVLHHDQTKDLSLIYFIAHEQFATAIIMDKAPPLTSTVLLYGYGEEWPALFTKGILSKKESIWEHHPYVWTANVHIWPGYSGCGVYNEDGELFGIASLMMISTKFYERLPWLCGFIPLPAIQEFLNDAGLPVESE
jgi:S1-C subfamily serine protease